MSQLISRSNLGMIRKNEMINQKMLIIDSEDPGNRESDITRDLKVESYTSVELLWSKQCEERQADDYSVYQGNKKLGKIERYALQYNQTVTFAKKFEVTIQFGEGGASSIDATILDSVAYILDHLLEDGALPKYNVTVNGNPYYGEEIAATPNIWINLTKKDQEETAESE